MQFHIPCTASSSIQVCAWGARAPRISRARAAFLGKERVAWSTRTLGEGEGHERATRDTERTTVFHWG